MNYKLKTVNGLRAVFSFTAFVLILFLSFRLATHFDQISLKIILVFGINIGSMILAIWFCVGTLTVNYSADKLNFKWTKRPFLDFRKFSEISINKIDKIIIDQNQIIRKIHTDKERIRLNTLRDNKIFKDDSSQFLKLINLIRRENRSIRFIDSWDDWNEKGYLKIAYWINTSIIAIGASIMILGWFIVGYKSIHLLFLIFLIPQLVIYQMTMKTKMNKNTGGNKANRL